MKPRTSSQSALLQSLRKNAAKKKEGGAISVGIVYLGSEKEGLGSLAFHGLYNLVNSHPRAYGERIFWAGDNVGSPKSIESSRPAGDFDLLAFTLAFEEQWVLLPHFLRAAGIPIRWLQRTQFHPLVVIGGIAVRANPQPGLPFVDVVTPSDAELCLPEILEVMAEGRSWSREEMLRTLSEIRGVAVRPPEGFCVRACFDNSGKPMAQFGTVCSPVFRNMFLVETGRGCPAGCRFCLVGFSRRPAHFFSPEQIQEAAQEGIVHGLRIGLVGASLFLHPKLPELLDSLGEGVADLSPASLNAQVIAGPWGNSLVRRLAQSGQKTITLAPETGSQRLSRFINKPLKEDELEKAVCALAEGGIYNLKLYFMFGLPTETDEDLFCLIDLVKRIKRWSLEPQKKRGRVGTIQVSINPFVPKPHTPLGREAMPTLRELRRRWRLLEKGIRRIGGISMSGYSVRHAVLQCLIDRGSERLPDLLEQSQGKWPPPFILLDEMVPELDEIVHRAWVPESKAVDVGVKGELLQGEFQKAQELKLTQPCESRRCAGCGACEGIPRGSENEVIP